MSTFTVALGCVAADGIMLLAVLYKGRLIRKGWQRPIIQRASSFTFGGACVAACVVSFLREGCSAMIVSYAVGPPTWLVITLLYWSAFDEMSVKSGGGSKTATVARVLKPAFCLSAFIVIVVIPGVLLVAACN
jgi:hypothetical protein